MLNVLFLCTGNSCRSVMAEGLLRHYSNGKFQSFSAGSNPTGEIHPISLKTLQNEGLSIDGFYSKPIREFENKKIDIVITVCSNAANEACPIFAGNALKAHWGVEDPAYFKGSEEQILAEFKRIYQILERRIKALCDLDILDKSLQEQLNEIGNYE